MSQVWFSTEFEGKPAKVMGGWDRPLGYWHFTIFDADPEADEELLWDGLGNLGFCRNLDTIKKLVQDLPLDVPEGFFEVIARQEGNVNYHWDALNKEWVRYEM